jgi:beta-glucuronidase
MASPVTGKGVLYPTDSESRTVYYLDGIWNFRPANESDPDVGHREGWYKVELRKVSTLLLFTFLFHYYCLLCMYVCISVMCRETPFTFKARNKFFSQSGPTIPMPVPASYNDITQDKAIRDHVGIVWYDRNFYVPHTWNSNVTKIWLRFGGVHYAAEVVS